MIMPPTKVTISLGMGIVPKVSTHSPGGTHSHWKRPESCAR